MLVGVAAVVDDIGGGGGGAYYTGHIMYSPELIDLLMQSDLIEPVSIDY